MMPAVGVAVVLSALEVEYGAVRAHLDHLERHRHPSGTIFEVGHLADTGVAVVLALVGEGNTNTAIVTEQAISMFRPQLVLFVGIAAGLSPDVAVGDVVAATRVYAYHGGTEGEEFSARPRSWDAPHAWDQLARHVAREDAWWARLPAGGLPSGPVVHFRPVAAGDVVLTSHDSELAHRLRRFYDDAVAVEMEGAGVARAAHISAAPALVIRGVGSSTDQPGAAAAQSLAAMHAAAFAMALLTEADNWVPQDDRGAGRPRREHGARRAPDQLPVDLKDFVGREAQLEMLDGHAADGAGTVVISAVDGTAGVGKTTLAVHWAHRATDLFPGGRLYIDLLGFAPGRPVQSRRALGLLLVALGVAESDIPATVDLRAARYQEELFGRRVLVVLDNAADVEHVRPLLPAADGCVGVVTSRHRLSALSVGANVRLVSLDVLSPAESVELLGAVLGNEAVAGEPQAAERLAHLCGHLPLALRIAAVRLLDRPMYRIEDAVAELAVEAERLDQLSLDGDDHATVRNVFSWSYQRLDAEEKHAFRLLGLLHGPSLGTRAIAALIRSTERRPRVVATLATLHLIEEDRPGRYRIHDLLRLYAAHLCRAEEPPAERRAALERLLHWYVVTAEAADGVLGNGTSRRVRPLPGRSDIAGEALDDADDALRWFDDEFATMLEVVRQAHGEGLFELCWRLPLATWSFFQRRSRWLDWVPLQELGLDAADRVGDRQAVAWLLTGLGDVLDDLERYEEAAEQHRAALMIQQELGNTRGAATAVNNLAVSLDNLEHYEEAIEHYEEALGLFRQLEDDDGVAMALNNLGAAHFMTDDLDAAERRYREALAVRREVASRDAFGEGMTLHNLGEVAEARGQLADAARWFEESLRFHDAAGHVRGRARALHRLGVVAQQRGDQGGARAYWESAVELYEGVGDPDADEVVALLDADRTSIGTGPARGRAGQDSTE